MSILVIGSASTSWYLGPNVFVLGTLTAMIPIGLLCGSFGGCLEESIVFILSSLVNGVLLAAISSAVTGLVSGHAMDSESKYEAS